MPIKNLTLGLCLLTAGTVHAHNTIYQVHKGDSVYGIADHFGISAKALMQANHLSSPKRLHEGTRLTIPSGAKTAHHSSSKGATHLYTVRNGDFDWAIAKRNGISVADLHRLNGGVNWTALQPGTKIRLSGHAATVAQAKHAKSSPTATYTVRSGDNDWIIASRAGISVHQLHAVNDGIRWSSLQPGQTIRVPYTATKSESTARIRSRYAAIHGNDVTVRRGASQGTAAICTVSSGTRVAVLDRQDSWYKLRFPKGTVGWVKGDFLKPVTEVAKRAKPAAKPHVAVRARKSKTTVAKRHHETTNYVAMNQKLDKGSADAILKSARSFRGVRYRWGQASRSGTDCSGFTVQVFRSQGVKLPRTSSEQSKQGQVVHYEDLQPGDLVFFHTVRGRRVGHVGIYMGNGKFIHASSGHGAVTVSSLADGFYHKRLVGARRVDKGASAAKKKKSGPKVEAMVIAPESIEEPMTAPDATPDVKSSDDSKE